MKKIVLGSGRITHILCPEEIIFMEKNLRKIIVHTTDGSLEYYGRFASIIPQLDRRFMCCHRSYIINMDMIRVMAENTIFFPGNIRILFGRETYGRAKREFEAYMKTI